MKFNLAIYIVFLFLYSCNTDLDDQEKLLRYFYSDGKRITDSTTIRVLANELDSLKKNTKFAGERNIYSTLNSEPNLDSLIDSLRAIYLENLKYKNPDEASLIDSEDSSMFFDVGIIIFDNKSGQTIYRSELENPHYSLSNLMGFGRTIRFLGFMMAMDKDYAFDDEFQAYERQEDTTFIRDRNGKIVYSYSRDGKMPLKDLFYFEPSGGIPTYPYQKYSEAEWLNFRSKLKIKLDTYSYWPNHGCEIETTFIDLVESFMLIRNEGVKKRTSLISKVTSSTGKVIYRNKVHSEKILSQETNNEMIQLLKYSVLTSNGRFIKEQLNLQNECFIYRGQNLKDLGWLLYSDKTKTIGIIVKGRNRLVHKNRNYSLHVEHEHKNIRTILPILKTLLASFE